MTGSPHILAIILSLPLALTLWGMLWFTTSVVSSAYFANLPPTNISYQNVLRITSISIVCALVGVVMIVAWFFRAQGPGAFRRRFHMHRSTTDHQAPSPLEMPPERPDMIRMTRMNASSPSTILDSSSTDSPARLDVYHPCSATPLDFSFIPSPHSVVRPVIDADIEAGDIGGSSPYGSLATPVSRAIYHPPLATSRRFGSTTSSVIRDVYHPLGAYGPHNTESGATRVQYHLPNGSDVGLRTIIPSLYSTPSLPSLPPSYSSVNVASQHIFPPPTVAQPAARFSPDISPFAHEIPISSRLASVPATLKSQPPSSFTDHLYPPRTVLRSSESFGPKLGTPIYRPSPLGPNGQTPRALPTPRPIPVSLPYHPLPAAAQVGRPRFDTSHTLSNPPRSLTSRNLSET
jgi:hypothetical protein